MARVGEKIWFHKIGEEGIKSFVKRIIQGIFVGHHDRTRAISYITEGGTVPASGAAEIRDRVQRTTGLLSGTRWWLHDLDSQQNSQGMRIHFQKQLDEYGMNDLIPVYLEKGALNFYLNREVKSAETHKVNECRAVFCEDSRETRTAEQCARKSNDNSEPRCSTHW